MDVDAPCGMTWRRGEKVSFYPAEPARCAKSCAGVWHTHIPLAMAPNPWAGTKQAIRCHSVVAAAPAPVSHV